MFRIKICGVTSVHDALLATTAGADAIGLNFYHASPRCVSLEAARQIANALPEGVKKVGVFVNAPPEEVLERTREAGLDLVQLHGDEPPEFLGCLPGLGVVRAFRTAGYLDQAAAYLAECRRRNRCPAMVLMDSYRKGEFGGTGITADWEAIRAGRHLLGSVPFALAGGLNPDNVGQAIATVRPDAVDTSSGVETSPGRKSPERLRAFILAARTAFDMPAES